MNQTPSNDVPSRNDGLDKGGEISLAVLEEGNKANTVTQKEGSLQNASEKLKKVSGSSASPPAELEVASTDANVHFTLIEFDRRESSDGIGIGAVHEDDLDSSKDFFSNALNNPQTSFEDGELSDRSESSGSKEITSEKVTRQGGDTDHCDRGVNFLTETGKDAEEREVIQFESDVFSLMIISRYVEPCFWFGVGVFAFQVSILSLIMVDLIHQDDGSLTGEGNRLNVPLNVDPQVWMAQVLALVVAAMSNDDARTSLKMISVGFHPKLQEDHPAATHGKFIIANVCRFLEASLSVVVAFIFIVQSDNVLDIFLNFAAVEFIGSMDNLAFELAAAGYAGERLRKKTEIAEEIQLPVSRKHLIWVGYFLFYLLILVLFGGWAVVRARQSNGYLLYHTSCSTFVIEFGDEQLDIFPGNSIDITGSFREDRILDRFDASQLETPPSVPYSYFSGTYIAEVSSSGNRFNEKNDRPVYYERGVVDPTSGRFYYCDDENAWVFSIPALGNNIPFTSRTKNCEWGWLAISAETDVYRLEEYESSQWDIWTGDELRATEDLSVECKECYGYRECTLTHGVCNTDTNVCECGDGWGGFACQIKLPFCDEIEWYSFGQTSRDFDTSGPFHLFHDGGADAPFVYERPVYRMEFTATEDDGRTCESDAREAVIFYAGRVWHYTSWCPLERRHIMDEHFHAYWDNVVYLNTDIVSAPTTGHKPVEDLEWTEVKVSGLEGLGSAGFHCLSGDCQEGVGGNTCGFAGTCQDGSCLCSNFFGGFLCEIAPTGNYASNEFEAYQSYLMNRFGNAQSVVYTPATFALRWWEPAVQGILATRTIPAIVEIYLDRHPLENSYSISSMQTGELLANFPPGSLAEVEAGAGYHSHLIYIDPNTEYRFTIEDIKGDGIHDMDPAYEIWALFPANYRKKLVEGSGSFGSTATRTFSLNLTTSTFPDPSAFVPGTIQVEILFSPNRFYETGYSIASADTNEVIADFPPGSFLSTWELFFAGDQLYNSRVFYLDPGSNYTFEILDSAPSSWPSEGGVKAEYNISAVLSTGEKLLLVHGDPLFDPSINNVTHSFLVPDAEDNDREL